jgi:OmpA-OmpF porin, OOP family
MSSSLVMGLTDVFKSQVLTPFAARSGESESSVMRGFEVSVGAMVAGLASKVRQSSAAPQVLDLINNPANDTGILDHPRSLLGEGENAGLGSKLTSMLFGGKLSGITNTISQESGLRTGTAASLMSLSAPLLLGLLGKRVREGGMDRSKLVSFMSQEAAEVQGRLPAGIGNLLGSESEVSPVPPVASAVVAERSSTWIWPVIALLAVAGALAWWISSKRATLQNAAATIPSFVIRVLPGNLNLRIPVGRMEDHLLVFIQDPTKAAGTTTWFDFDRLLFDINSATLQPASEEQLGNIAAILKAYPNVHVKVGGYTDNTGDASANQLLSQQRADTVKQQLINMGISPDRLEAQGYGSQYAVADNATEEGRQKNRRISLLVTQK